MTSNGNFSMYENCVILGNTAEMGGGVYNAGTFNMRGNVISGNTAVHYDNIYSHNGVSKLPDENSGLVNTLFIVLTIALTISIIAVFLFYLQKRRKSNAK